MTDTHDLQADVAFLRTLVSGGEQWLRPFGEGYFAAGLVYGAQMLMHTGQFLGLLPGSGLWSLAIGLGPTIVFIPIIIWVNVRASRGAAPAPAGRAVGAVFGAVGLANLALVAVIGSVAWREHSLTTWLIYPCAVFILQGAAWLVACAMRRRGWMLWVGLGWFATALGMGISVTHIAWYVGFAGIGIWICMALPGWVMLRAAGKARDAARDAHSASA